MPKRDDIDTIMIIGAGPIIIGQACEFDYSGTQACKALKQEGYRVVLVNSNPATIMTDPNMADATYIEPITPEMVANILRDERKKYPDHHMALLPTMGGQTALNTALALERMGILEELEIEMIGAKADVIDKAEDRERFRQAMDKIGLESPKSRQVNSYDEALLALNDVGLPAIIRPSFTMGGTGGGIAYNDEEFEAIVKGGLDASPTNTVLIEESVLGWKEFEMEVVRDHDDNCIIICAIENIDPMGIHTGDSITIAPTLTLSDREYQVMRNASIKVLREIGVETGGSNVQFAVNPENGRLVVIEMNPRVSRSSALASKATGFPIAKIAAKLAVGYSLDELKNDITQITPASFEPSIDYIVTKIPRFTFEKFSQAKPELTTSMKSVGEAMAIGRCFKESMQKALRSLETGLSGFDEIALPHDKKAALDLIARPEPERLLRIAEGLRKGLSGDEIHQICHIDPWFLREIEEIIMMERDFRERSVTGLETLTSQDWLSYKQAGFSDERLAKLCNQTPAIIRAHRHKCHVRPSYRLVDSVAGEFQSKTAYFYSSYDGGFGRNADEANLSDKDKVIILGGGPNRIGQGIEFDYCCVHAAYALKAMNIEAIMVNCNPETVSTDYDTSDRLYFEPLTDEDVLEICFKEQERGRLLGVIVQFGGQTPLKLSQALNEANIPILGTSSDAIDLAEDRERFQKLIQEQGLKQPANGLATHKDQAVKIANMVGYPIVIRPSYVLGGRAMEIVHNEDELRHYIDHAVVVSGANPVLIDSYLREAIEVDVDALSDGENVYVSGIMQHIEEAGIHSGDSACSLPPYSLPDNIIDEIAYQTTRLALALNVIGLMNVQFAVMRNEVYILEVNPRASRTAPFVAKATLIPIVAIATKIMAAKALNEANQDNQAKAKIQDYGLALNDKMSARKLNHVAVKESVFPFRRFPGVDVLLGPEMKSTGEVMGIDRSFAKAFAKAQLGAGVVLPKEGMILISVKDDDKPHLKEIILLLSDLGYRFMATKGTAKYYADHVTMEIVKKANQGNDNTVTALLEGKIAMVFNTTEANPQAREDSKTMRQEALMRNIPYFTTRDGIKAVAYALEAIAKDDLSVTALQDYKPAHS